MRFACVTSEGKCLRCAVVVGCVCGCVGEDNIDRQAIVDCLGKGCGEDKCAVFANGGVGNDDGRGVFVVDCSDSSIGDIDRSKRYSGGDQVVHGDSERFTGFDKGVVVDGDSKRLRLACDTGERDGLWRGVKVVGGCCAGGEVHVNREASINGGIQRCSERQRAVFVDRDVVDGDTCGVVVQDGSGSGVGNVDGSNGDGCGDNVVQRDRQRFDRFDNSVVIDWYAEDLGFA